MLHKYMKEYDFSRHYPLHMPGHKRLFGEYSVKDITEIPHFDDLHAPKGLILEVERGYSLFYGSKVSKLSVNGSTGAILAAMAGVAKLSRHILVGRQAHKSVYNALLLNEMTPYFIYPLVEERTQIAIGYDYDEIDRLLKDNKEIKSMVFTTPTYEGVILDIKRLKKIATYRGVVLIIDEAHGAHLGIENKSAINLGADIVVQSLHKMLPSLTQTAILHLSSRLNEELVDEIINNMKIYQTSSPSYLLMASMSECLEFLINEARGCYNEAIENIEKLRLKMSRLRYLRLLGTDDIGGGELDLYKLVIVTTSSSIGGKELYSLLFELGYTLEMCTDTFVTAFLSPVDDWERVEKFVDTLIEVDQNLSEGELVEGQRYFLDATQVISLDKVRRLSAQKVKVCKALARVAARPVYLYPPGIPIVSYGELIDEKIMGAINYYKDKGLIDLEEVFVLKES